MPMQYPRVVLLAVTLVATACGGDDGGDDGDDGAPPPCPVAASFGSVTPTMQLAVYTMETGAPTPDFYQYETPLDTAEQPDVFAIQMYSGYGTFTDGFPTQFPATIPIAGDEGQYATCGACVVILPDVQADGTETGNSYLATSGTLTIDSMSPMLTGSLSNLVFTQVVLDDENMSNPDPSGCTSSIDALAFSVMPMPVEGTAR